MLVASSAVRMQFLNMPAARHHAIDIVRGLSICIMVPANMSALVYAEPHAWWFRVVTSLAAPMFIFLAGLMVGIGSQAKKYSWDYFALRGGLVIVVAALIDSLIWGLLPFHTFDVLYLIGLSLPLGYAFTKLGRTWQWLTIGGILLLTPVMQAVVGYQPQLPGISLSNGVGHALAQIAKDPAVIGRHFFLDGWFPVLPWLAVPMAGAMAAQHWRYPEAAESQTKMGRWGAALSLLGLFAWWLYPGAQYVRGGYSELFYPPTPGFIVFGIGVAMVALWAATWRSEAWPLLPLRWLGKTSLFIYILHYAINHYWLNRAYRDSSLETFAAINLVVLAGLILVAWLLGQLARLWKSRPFLVRFLLGG